MGGGRGAPAGVRTRTQPRRGGPRTRRERPGDPRTRTRTNAWRLPGLIAPTSRDRAAPTLRRIIIRRQFQPFALRPSPLAFGLWPPPGAHGPAAYRRRLRASGAGLAGTLAPPHGGTWPGTGGARLLPSCCSPLRAFAALPERCAPARRAQRLIAPASRERPHAGACGLWLRRIIIRRQFQPFALRPSPLAFRLWPFASPRSARTGRLPASATGRGWRGPFVRARIRPLCAGGGRR